MTRKYDIRLIWNYINGLEIDNVDELENDYKFMMSVIEITRDKKMYNLCSDEMKTNYEFVKFIINIFKEDKKFICKIANEYINIVDNNDITVKELIFMMCEIFKDYKDEDVYLKYFVMRASIYSLERLSIDMIIEQEEDLFWKKQFGLGFILTQIREFGLSDIITKYVAKELKYFMKRIV